MWNLQHSRGSVISMTTAEQHDARTGTSPSQASIRWIRIIPVALIMYTIAFIDRTNISLALPHISRDLHLDPQQAGTVAGIFFWGYLALQIPGGHLAKHCSAKKFISVQLVVWALFGIGFFWMDFGPLELAGDAGRRRLVTFFVASGLAGIYSRPSLASVLSSGRRAHSSGGNLAPRVF